MTGPIRPPCYKARGGCFAQYIEENGAITCYADPCMFVTREGTSPMACRWRADSVRGVEDPQRLEAASIALALVLMDETIRRAKDIRMLTTQELKNLAQTHACAVYIGANARKEGKHD